MAKKRIILAGTLLLLAGTIAFLLCLPRVQPSQTVALASGSTVTFAGVTYGKPAIAPTGSWKRRLAFLPDSLLRRLNIYPGPTVTMQSNHLTIWLYVTPPGSTDLFNISANPFSLVDENGVESYAPNFLPYAFPSYTGSNGPSLQGLDLAAFPRRAKNFRLRIYSQDSQDKLSLRGEMTILNPAFRGYPNWQPDPLPITKTNGDVAITLTKLSTGMSMFSPKPAATNEESWGRAFFTFDRAGKPDRDWTVDNIEFSDATSNRVIAAAWSYEAGKPGQGTFQFRTPLWPAESAWKLKVTLARKATAKFATNELWAVTNLLLPTLNATNVLNLETNLNGANLKFLSLTDESGMLPSETLKSDHCVRLTFCVPPLPVGMRFDIVSVTGTAVRTEINSGGIQSYDYMVPVSARTLDVKVTVYRGLTPEFIVKPTMVSGSDSVSKVK